MRAWWVLAALMTVTLSGCFGDRADELEPRFAPQGAPGVDVDDVRERFNQTSKTPVCGVKVATGGSNEGSQNGTAGNASSNTTGQQGQMSEEAGQDPSGNGSTNETDGAADREKQVDTHGMQVETHDDQDCLRVANGTTSVSWDDLLVQIDTDQVLEVRFNEENVTKASRTAHVLRPSGAISEGDQFRFCSTGLTARNVTVSADDPEDAQVFWSMFETVARCG